jgi:hypothetical protein
VDQWLRHLQKPEPQQMIAIKHGVISQFFHKMNLRRCCYSPQELEIRNMKSAEFVAKFHALVETEKISEKNAYEEEVRLGKYYSEQLDRCILQCKNKLDEII